MAEMNEERPRGEGPRSRRPDGRRGQSKEGNTFRGRNLRNGERSGYRGDNQGGRSRGSSLGGGGGRRAEERRRDRDDWIARDDLPNRQARDGGARGGRTFERGSRDETSERGVRKGFREDRRKEGGKRERSEGFRGDRREDRAHRGDDRKFASRERNRFRAGAEEREGRGYRSGRKDACVDRRHGQDRGYVRREEAREERIVEGPPIPEGFEERALSFGVRAELRGLSRDRAERVAAHIWAAGQLVDEDPELAFRHAETARQLAPRLPIVREAAAETAYATGEYAIALREYRAIRRMSGGDELIPVLADCERALGRPRDALQILSELDLRHAPVALAIEAIIVESGVRDDLGQRSEGLRLLKRVIDQGVGPKAARARLWYAYAELLFADGRADAAREAFIEAGRLDHGTALDTSDRIAELDGVTLPESMDDDLEEEIETDLEEQQAAMQRQGKS